MILRTPYDEAYANDHLAFWIYSLTNPTHPCIQDEVNILLRQSFKLNKRRTYLTPENTVRDQKMEDEEIHMSMKEIFMAENLFSHD